MKRGPKPIARCRNGHEFTPENIVLGMTRGRRTRLCRICRDSRRVREKRGRDSDLSRAKRRAKRASRKYGIEFSVEEFLELESTLRSLELGSTQCALWRSMEARIQKDPELGCWLWTGAWKREGYGEVTIKGEVCYVHRVMYERFCGPIPEGYHLHHLCWHRHCVNPAHLLAVSPREHQDFEWRNIGFQNKAKTHCLNGHEFNEQNTYITANGGRDCRVCHNEFEKQSYHRRKAQIAWQEKEPTRTHCRKGHALTPENTYKRPDGRAVCKICKAEAEHERAKRAAIC
jgi:HNH endonuclease